MNFQKGKKNDELEINFIPLIDVLLVIIIFLVVSTTFARFSQLKINLPVAEANISDKTQEHINVAISKDGQYSINEKLINAKTVAELTIKLRELSNSRLDNPLVINADALASHQSVINVMEASRQAGLTKITFSTKVN
ncbi:biopolymer transporter ExbD [Methylophilaceae bacterium]|jgi:biopolymer transport protein ExbD|nr:biopolymer transporter ExbD [Methylophilaceae bacterium]|tara:strand:- start:1840 stop:2253 length:414 start_codon:yes stop_codon:yes gene_type:complete